MKANSNGHIIFDITDNQIPLEGAKSILGRGCVIHEKPDDEGKGGHSDSLTTGHAGARMGCGVVAASFKKEE